MGEKDKTYNAKDFERYYNGTMTHAEMHELEKAALEDPFLADALEGYAYSSSIASDINELRSRLNEKQKKRNVFPLFGVRQNGWWRIAALLVVIAGGSYLFYQVNYKNNTGKNVAINRREDSAKKQDNSIIAADTTLNNSVAFEKLPGHVERKKAVAPTPTPAKESETLTGNKNRVSPHPETSSKSAENKFLPDTAITEIAANGIDKKLAKKYTFKGKVTDEAGKPLAFATIADKGKNRATVTDTTGNFMLQSNDSSINAKVSALGYNAKDVKLDENKQPTITVDKTDAALSEVVVTGYGVKKNNRKKASVPKQLANKASGTEITPPLDNNERFDAYIKENIIPLYDKNNVHLTGEVLLSFNINKRGRPRHIKIIRSSCQACENEATRLLQDGPDWSKEKDIVRNVLIKF